MANKNIWIRKNSVMLLYNKAKGKAISKNPQIKRLTEEKLIEILCKAYLGG